MARSKQDGKHRSRPRKESRWQTAKNRRLARATRHRLKQQLPEVYDQELQEDAESWWDELAYGHYLQDEADNYLAYENPEYVEDAYEDGWDEYVGYPHDPYEGDEPHFWDDVIDPEPSLELIIGLERAIDRLGLNAVRTQRSLLATVFGVSITEVERAISFTKAGYIPSWR